MPHDPVFTNSYHCCLPGYYSELMPMPLKGARLLYYNDALARDLALDSALFTGEETGVWSDERLLPGCSRRRRCTACISSAFGTVDLGMAAARRAAVSGGQKR